ncbi:MAG: DUF1080 domain-containing protein [Pirellulales bacterium]|nr:DUF1080 domain-containing protein [Pirellulales bacterium]
MMLAVMLRLVAAANDLAGAEPADGETVTLAHEAHNSLTKEELAEGWILLFDGETDYGWKAGSQANWRVHDGVISVSEGEPGLLTTVSQFGDYVFKCDFRADAGTNSGIFLRTPRVPKDPQSDCYELNIADRAVSPFPTGSFVGRQASKEVADSSRWRNFEVTALGGHFIVKLDGREVLDYTDPQPLGRGYIGLQLNKGAVEFRNIKLKPLGLEPLFNGQDLTGWKEFPGKASKFSVTDAGELHIENGNGQLETERSFGDFVAQWQVQTQGRHLNSGVFFRSIPGEFTQGYECQIQNAFEGNDRSKPVDCGTGGFYRRQNARRVMSNDFQWTPMTLIVSGNHMAAWVNGIQVSDWTDSRPPDANPRKGTRRETGTISLQGHDPTTNILFRDIQAGEMPKR